MVDDKWLVAKRAHGKASTYSIKTLLGYEPGDLTVQPPPQKKTIEGRLIFFA